MLRLQSTPTSANSNPMDVNNDPSGASRASRGLQSYWDYQTQHPQMADGSGIGYIPTVHPSSQWEGFFQAIQDAGGGMAGGAGLPADPDQGHPAPDPFAAAPSTYQPGLGQESASQPAPYAHPPLQSQPGINPMAVAGLKKATPHSPHPAGGQ